MATVNFKGNPVSIKGEIPSAGTKAEDFTFVKGDLTEAKLYDYDDKVKVIIAVPSLDTKVCALETRKFNEKLGEKTNVEGIVISKDLPFAINRFCDENKINNITRASDFRYNEFGQKFNTDITEGSLKGLSSRAVFVIDKNNVVRYSELVDDIGNEPDYDKALQVVEELNR